jgi:hypothetical protein
VSNKVDIVYPLGGGSIWSDNELKYSLRSLEKYGKNVGQIFIVGTHFPQFLNGVKYIRQRLDVLNYHAQISHAYYTACINGVSDRFVIMNDDFFLNKEVDFDHFKNYVRDYDLRQHLARFGSGYFYGKQIANTVKNLTRYLHFDSHYPMMFEREKYIELYENNRTLIERPTTVLIRSFYGNKYNLNGKVMPDLKVSNKYDVEKINDRPFWSVGNSGLHFVKDILKKQFPEKSKYEV